jgi:hypothetical protein
MRKKGLGIFSVVLIFGIMLSGCEQPTEAKTFSSDPRLTEIKVAGVTATLGNPSESWQTAEPGIVYLTKEQATNPKVEIAKSEGESIAYFASTAGKPNFAESGEFKGSLEFGTYLWVEVVSANHDALLFYKIAVELNVPDLSEVVVAGRNATLGTPGATWNDPALSAGTVIIGKSVLADSQLENFGVDVEAITTRTIAAAPLVPSTTVRYAVASGTGEPSFAVAPVTLLVKKGDFIYVEATGVGEKPDTSKVLIYKIAVDTKFDDVSFITVKDTANSNAALSIGTGGSAYGAAVTGTLYRPTSGSISIAGTKAATSAVVYGVATASDTEPATWSPSTSLTVPPGQYAAIRVTAEIGDVWYYKFQVTYGATDTTITSVTIGGVTVTNLGAGGPTLPVAPGGFGAAPGPDTITAAAYLTTTEAANATIVATGVPTGAVAEYTTASYSGSSPGYETWNPGDYTDGTGFAIPDSGAFFVVRVTAADKVTQSYYLMEAIVKAPPTLTSLGLAGAYNSVTYAWAATVPVTDLGTPAATLAAVGEGSVSITSAQAVDAPVIGAASRTSGVTISYAKTTSANPNDSDFVVAGGGGYSAPTPSLAFANNDILWVKVAGPTELGTNYYKIKVTVNTLAIGDVVLDTLSLGSVPVTVPAVGASGAVTIAGAATGSVALTELSQLRSAPTGTPKNGTVIYAKTSGAAAAEESAFAANLTNPLWVSGDVLWVKVQLDTLTNYYKIAVTVPAFSPTLSGLTIGGTNVPLANIGTPAATWNGATLITGRTTSTGQASATAADPRATVEYVIATDLTTTPTFAGTAPTVADNDYLYIKVTAGTLVSVYRIKVNTDISRSVR